MNIDELTRSIEETLLNLSDQAGDVGIAPLLGFVIPENPRITAVHIVSNLVSQGLLSSDPVNVVNVDTTFNKDTVKGTVKANISLIDAMRALFTPNTNDTK